MRTKFQVEGLRELQANLSQLKKSTGARPGDAGSGWRLAVKRGEA